MPRNLDNFSVFEIDASIVALNQLFNRLAQATDGDDPELAMGLSTALQVLERLRDHLMRAGL